MVRRVSLDQPKEVIRAIEEDGGVVLAGFASAAQVDQVNQDVQEIVTKRANDEEWKARYHGRIYCGLLFGRSETAREQWVLQPQLQSVINHFLCTVNSPEVDRNSAEGRSTNAILSQATTIVTLPGGTAQALHRDDAIWQKVHTSQEGTGYRLGSDLGIGLLIAGVDVTPENGATVFIPGSHLWADERQGSSEHAIPAEMQRGDAFLFLSSVLHAGGGNTTQSPRTLHTFFFCRSWVRPEANDFGWWRRDEVDKWSLDAQKLAGYVTDKMLGICDDGDPIDALCRHDVGE